jgi:hypothetical protein
MREFRPREYRGAATAPVKSRWHGTSYSPSRNASARETMIAPLARQTLQHHLEALPAFPISECHSGSNADSPCRSATQPGARSARPADHPHSVPYSKIHVNKASNDQLTVTTFSTKFIIQITRMRDVIFFFFTRKIDDYFTRKSDFVYER